MAYPRNTDRTPVDVMGPFLLVIGVAVAVLSLAWIASVAVPKSRYTHVTNHLICYIISYVAFRLVILNLLITDLGPVTSKPLTRGLILIGYVLVRVCYIFASSFVIFGYIWLVLNG